VYPVGVEPVEEPIPLPVEGPVVEWPSELVRRLGAPVVKGMTDAQR
jgi:hypothetical protein